MSGENEAAGSSKAEPTEPDCNAENVLTSSTNYDRAERESPIATFQALKNSVIERVPGIAGDANLLSAASIPLINNSSNNNDSKISAINNNNNNNNVANPNKRLFECDVCKMS